MQVVHGGEWARHGTWLHGNVGKATGIAENLQSTRPEARPEAMVDWRARGLVMDAGWH